MGVYLYTKYIQYTHIVKDLEGGLKCRVSVNRFIEHTCRQDERRWGGEWTVQTIGRDMTRSQAGWERGHRVQPRMIEGQRGEGTVRMMTGDRQRWPDRNMRCRHSTLAISQAQNRTSYVADRVNRPGAQPAGLDRTRLDWQKTIFN